MASRGVGTACYRLAVHSLAVCCFAIISVLKRFSFGFNCRWRSALRKVWENKQKVCGGGSHRLFSVNSGDLNKRVYLGWMAMGNYSRAKSAENRQQQIQQQICDVWQHCSQDSHCGVETSSKCSSLSWFYCWRWKNFFFWFFIFVVLSWTRIIHPPQQPETLNK